MIILKPSKKTAKKYIQASQKLFAKQNHGYVLTEKGMPHLTICQFQCEQKEKAAHLWEEIRKNQLQSMPIYFTSLSLVRGKKEHQGLYWAELSAAREQKLLKVYQDINFLIEKKGFTILNHHEGYYRPHITLARIKLPYTIQSWPSTLLRQETFRLGWSPCVAPFKF